MQEYSAFRYRKSIAEKTPRCKVNGENFYLHRGDSRGMITSDILCNCAFGFSKEKERKSNESR